MSVFLLFFGAIFKSDCFSPAKVSSSADSKQILFPLGGFGRFAVGVVKLDKGLQRFLEPPLLPGRNAAPAILHALAAGEQQRLGLGGFSLTLKATGQQGSRFKCLPVTGD